MSTFDKVDGIFDEDATSNAGDSALGAAAVGGMALPDFGSNTERNDAQNTVESELTEGVSREGTTSQEIELRPTEK